MQNISTLIYLCNTTDSIYAEGELIDMSDLSISRDTVLKQALDGLKRSTPQYLVDDLLSYAQEVV